MNRKKGLSRRSPRRDGSDRDERRSGALSKANPPRVQDDQPPRKRKPKRVEFYRPEPARNFLCARCGEETGRRAAHWHHWLPQQHIRTYVRSRRLPDDEARALLTRVLHDRRNLSPLCVECHDEEGGVLRLGDVPQEAHDFACELGPEWIAKLLARYKVWPRRPKAS